MAELPIRQPSGDTEAMYRELIPGPNAADYPHLQCPNDYPHEFQVDLGDANPFHIASIQMVCNGSQDGHLLLDDVPPKRCDTQQGPLRSVADMRRFIDLKMGFRPLNNKLHHLWDLIMKTRDALAAISGEQFPPLPPKTAEITLKGKGKESTSAWPRRSTTPLFDEDVGVKYNEDGLIPDLNVLETVLPTGGQLLHIVIYYDGGLFHYTSVAGRQTQLRLSSQRTISRDLLGRGTACLPCHRRTVFAPPQTRSTWLAALWFVVAPTSLKRVASGSIAGRSELAIRPLQLPHQLPFSTSRLARLPLKRASWTRNARWCPILWRDTRGGRTEQTRRMDEDEEVAPPPIALSKLDKLRALDEKIKTHGFPDQAPLSLASSDFESEVDIFSLPPSDDVVSSDGRSTVGSAHESSYELEPCYEFNVDCDDTMNPTFREPLLNNS
ncbi:hypothetical protein DFH06DRAFT_1152922 [Mycena polygramma]|nr:hypothetical protein DFH06DRAFT_1152922 [Mycena polygramma]